MVHNSPLSCPTPLFPPPTLPGPAGGPHFPPGVMVPEGRSSSYPLMMKALQLLVDAILVFAVVALLPFAWLMRDGLGSDSTTSSGIQAVARCFMTFYSGPILVGLVALAVVCHRTGKRKQPDAAEPLNALD